MWSSSSGQNQMQPIIVVLLLLPAEVELGSFNVNVLSTPYFKTVSSWITSYWLLICCSKASDELPTNAKEIKTINSTTSNELIMPSMPAVAILQTAFEQIRAQFLDDEKLLCKNLQLIKEVLSGNQIGVVN